MPRATQAHAWWVEVEDVRERIERRREREQRSAVRGTAKLRGEREVRPGRHLSVVRAQVDTSRSSVPAEVRRRSRPPVVRSIGPRPDRVAAWAVVLGFALVLAAVLSSH